MSAPVFRLAEVSDLPAASSLACATFMQDVAPQFGSQGTELFLDYAGLEDWTLRHAGGHRTWLAEEDGRLVGVIHFRGETHLSMLFVAPGRQRRGIGRRLVQLATAGVPDREVTVHASPNAVGAYQNFGFIATGPETEESGIRYVPMRRPPARPAS